MTLPRAKPRFETSRERQPHESAVTASPDRDRRADAVLGGPPTLPADAGFAPRTDGPPDGAVDCNQWQGAVREGENTSPSSPKTQPRLVVGLFSVMFRGLLWHGPMFDRDQPASRRATCDDHGNRA